MHTYVSMYFQERKLYLTTNASQEIQAVIWYTKTLLQNHKVTQVHTPPYI